METMSLEEATVLRGIYRLLARLYLGEMDAACLRDLRSPPLCVAFQDAGGIVPTGDKHGTVELLARDYCRLFVGPTGHLPPCQSVWESGQFQGPATLSMQRFIDCVGYDTGVLPRGMMLDHFGVQLDVMAHILGQTVAWQAAEDRVRELARTFSATHLAWSRTLLAAAEARATTDFYRAVIRLTRAFLAGET